MRQITRRDLLGGGAKGALALGATSLLAACGSSSSSSSSVASSSAASVGQPRFGGTLRVGLTGGSSSDTVDPNTATNNSDYARIANLYDPLVELDAQGVPRLRVAEEIAPNATGTRWTVRLRKGVMFHDGREATADDLLFSIQRVINPKSPGQAANIFSPLDAAAMRKVDRYTIELPFKKPYSTFFENLGNLGTTPYLLPVGYDVKHPIGSGPFKLVSFTPGQQTILSRFSEYWDHPHPYLDQVVLTDYSDETSQVNALLSGQVDAVNLLSQDVLGSVQSAGKKVVISLGGGWNPFTMRVDQPPFDDVRVRQAFRLIVDRPSMMQVVFGGHGTLGNDIFSIWSSEYDHQIPQRHQDIEQAKHLLKAAGREGLTVELVTADIAQGVINMAQVFAQQAQAAGVTVKLRQITPTEFYGPNYLKWLFAQDYWYYSEYYTQVNEATLPTSPFNECHFNNPRYNALYQEAEATMDPAKRIEIAHEMQMIDWTEGGYIIPFFVPVIDGYAPNVDGAVQSRNGASFNEYRFRDLWLA